MEAVMLDQYFSWAGNLAFLGWGALLLSPLAPVWADRIAGLAVPALLSAGYAALMLMHWADAPGGFGSLTEVAALLSHPPMLLAGWVHFLAFDLFVGAWIVRTARAEGIAFAWVVPCLPVTLMFGPAGYLLFTAIRAARGATRRAGAEAGA
jgi:hypothetical protein